MIDLEKKTDVFKRENEILRGENEQLRSVLTALSDRQKTIEKMLMQ